MRWGGDEVGVVLSRNEIWLLLHALSGAKMPSVDWEGIVLEPWVVGELRSRLQSALRPDPLSDLEERPIIRLDSDMGRSLAMAEVRPLVIEDGYDLGSLVSACAERGWGAELRLPAGGGPETPAEARILVSQPGAGSPREFVGLERPVVAFARALVGAAFGTQAGGTSAPSNAMEPGPSRPFEEHIIFAEGVNPGEREETISKMASKGWDLVEDDGERIVFRREPRSA